MIQTKPLKKIIFDQIKSNEEEIRCRSCNKIFPSLYAYYSDPNHRCFSEQERNVLKREIIRQKSILSGF